ncbi:MAG TPA: AraC family transcriptional regulator [Pyrinomonadaceae bacterium]|nr:AraC family transcriptional regulator [Pyrinomonadaceae bacterium]
MDPRIETVITVIGNNIGDDLVLAQMAQLASLPSSRLRHMFKNELGTTPNRYRHSLRMKRARELLETKFLSVKEVATLVGVHGESRFVQEFKRAYGLTPGLYRNSLNARSGRRRTPASAR